MSGEPERAVGTYFAISLHSLRLDTLLTFDLYLHHSGGPYLLYRNSQTPFTEQVLQNLRNNRVTELHVPREQRDVYFEYASQEVKAVVEDETLTPAEKAEAVYRTTTGIMEDLFVTPRSTVRIEQAKSTIGHTVDLMLRDEQAARSLMFLTSHDYYTYTHSVNVTLFAVALTQRVFKRDISDEEYRILGQGFLLHDIGKSSIPPSIINKPGKLNSTEWALMREHPLTGQKILQDTEQLNDAIDQIVVGHHERMDGRGYPYGLSGESVHPYSRICAIADVFDAITTVRSYRDPLGTFAALKVMRDEMGDHFDWDYFDEFVKLFQQE
jgi:HD-GYP domain-containing protein (c-di-GMP phosphodiesterase class II)